MSDNNQMYEKIIPELQKYADLDGTEWGETIIMLINLWMSRTLLSEEFIKQLEAEMKYWLMDVKENAVIIEEVITPDNKPYTVKSLEWI